ARGGRAPIKQMERRAMAGGATQGTIDMSMLTTRTDTPSADQPLAGPMNRTDKPQGDKTFLIVDDDKPFLQRLARAMESRGYVVDTADTVAEGLRKADAAPPAFAVVDMR